MTTIAKNNSGSPQEFLSIILDDGSQRTISDEYSPFEISQDIELQALIASGDIVINDGTNDLSVSDAQKLTAAGNPELVTQAEAEAGTATDIRYWSSERVAQAIAAQAGSGAIESYLNTFFPWQHTVINVQSQPPVGPSTGDRYIVDGSASDDWLGQENRIAEWNGSIWVFYLAFAGWTVYVTSEDLYYRFSGSVWDKMGKGLRHNDLTQLDGGATDDYYHLTQVEYNDLTDTGNTTLHYHATDRDRANHTGTQTASTISDFDTEVSNNTDVAANTAARHNAVTLNSDDPTQETLNLVGQEIQVNLATASTDGAMSATDKSKLDGIEAGAEVNNISDVNATDLTDGGDSTLHYHASDRDRANHTGTQVAATISDFNEAAQDAVGTIFSNEFTYNDGAPSISLNYANISHTDLQDIGANTHAQIDTHIADDDIHFRQSQFKRYKTSNQGINGNANINFNTGDSNTTDVNRINNSTYQLNTIGWYEVEYHINIRQNDVFLGSNTRVDGRIQLDTGSGFSNLDESYFQVYNYDGGSDENMVSGKAFINVTASNSWDIRVRTGGGNGQTFAEGPGCSLHIRYLGDY